MDIGRMLRKSFYPWLIAKVSAFVTAFIILGIVIGAAISNPLMGLLIFFTLASSDLLTVLITIGFTAFIFMYLHQRFIGNIDLTTSVFVVAIPGFIMYLANIEGFLLALIIDYIVFSFIYSYFRGGG